MKRTIIYVFCPKRLRIFEDAGGSTITKLIIA